MYVFLIQISKLIILKIYLYFDIMQRFFSFENYISLHQRNTLTNNDLLDQIIKIRNICKLKNIRYYIVYCVESGFGDIITNACIASFFQDLYGLQYLGIDKLENTQTLTGRKFYSKFLKDLGFQELHSKHSIAYIKINNFLLEHNNIYKSLLEIDDESIICIRPKQLFMASDYDEIANLGLNIYENSFTKHFQNLLTKFNFYNRINYNPNKSIITIHLRLGDSAVVPINNNGDIIALDWFFRENHPHALFNIKNRQGSRYVQHKYQELDELIQFVKQIHSLEGNIEINLITDGFESALAKINSHRFQKICHSKNKIFKKEIVYRYIKNVYSKLHRAGFCSIVAGENYQDFLDSIILILSSNIVISNHRSFCARVFFGWKKDKFFQQTFFSKSQEGQGSNILLNKLGITQKKFTNYESILTEIYVEEDRTISVKHEIFGAQERIKNHLAYQLGNAMVANSNSLLGYIKMPFILSYITEIYHKNQENHKQSNQKYPKLECYSDYQEALQIKNSPNYKLGIALIKAKKRGGGLFNYLSLFKQSYRLSKIQRKG